VSLLEGIEALTGAGLEHAIKGADALAEEHLEGDDLMAVKGGLALLEVYRGDLAHLTTGAALSVLTNLAVGRVSAARMVYLAGGASYETRRIASHNSTAEAVGAAFTRETEWERIVDMAERIGTGLLKLLPLLILGG